MPLSINPEQKLISIETYVVEENRKHGNKLYYFVDSQDSLNDYLGRGYILEGNPMPEGHTKIINKIQTTWKIPTWGEHNYILSKALKPVGDTKNRRYEIDPIKYREEKIKLLLKRWNLVDSNGNTVDVSAATIDSLPPEIANQLLQDFEKIAEPEDNDTKK